jgi:hypothetical protein
VQQVGAYDTVCTYRGADPFTNVPGAGEDLTRRYLPQGGTVSVLASGEARVDWAYGVSFAPFVDAGLLAPDLGSVGLDDVRFGVGVGARYKSLVGPIRLDVSLRPLYPEDGGPNSVSGCRAADAIPRAFDLLGVSLNQRYLDKRGFPLALNVMIAIGEAFLMTEGAPAPVPPPPRRRRRWGRWLVGLGGSAVVVVALSGLTGWVWLRSAAGGPLRRAAGVERRFNRSRRGLPRDRRLLDGRLVPPHADGRRAAGRRRRGAPVDRHHRRRTAPGRQPVAPAGGRREGRRGRRPRGAGPSLGRAVGLLALLPSNPDAPPSDVLIPVDLDVRQIVATDVVVASGAQSFTGGVDASLRARGGDLSVLGLALAGDVVGPAHGPLALHGRATVGAHDVRLDGLTIVGFPGDLAVSGGVLGYDADTRLDLQVGARPVDLGAVDPLLGAGLKGQWSGVFGVHGPLTALVVQGPLAGAGASRGAADLAVTLDVGSPELSWTAEGDLRDVHLEDLLGTVTKPVVLGGRARVTGRGSRWPEDIVVQGAFDGGPQEAYGYRFSKLAGGFRVEGGVVHLDGLEATHAAVDGVVNGTIDVVNGPMDLDVRGVADLAGLAELGSPGVRGRGPLTVRVRGDVLADVVDVGFTGSLDVAGFAYADDVRAARLVGTFDGRSVGSDVVVDADVTLTDAVSNGLSVARVHEPHVHVERRGGRPARRRRAPGPSSNRRSTRARSPSRTGPPRGRCRWRRPATTTSRRRSTSAPTTCSGSRPTTAWWS